MPQGHARRTGVHRSSCRLEGDAVRSASSSCSVFKDHVPVSTSPCAVSARTDPASTTPRGFWLASTTRPGRDIPYYRKWPSRSSALRLRSSSSSVRMTSGLLKRSGSIPREVDVSTWPKRGSSPTAVSAHPTTAMLVSTTLRSMAEVKSLTTGPTGGRSTRRQGTSKVQNTEMTQRAGAANGIADGSTTRRSQMHLAETARRERENRADVSTFVRLSTGDRAASCSTTDSSSLYERVCRGSTEKVTSGARPPGPQPTCRP
jgi:hypothetical protein